ncbi:MAG: bacillithiol biosynthesis cysteine-adding enzyme BshC [Cyclobacteriaceae bacterium]|nr:bacillithiol biosynthesis cysteine-adding enzyme BshC [Cyclobacteriaceae bacterium]
MIVEKIPFSHTGQFSKAFTDYVDGNPALRDLYNLPPEKGSFIKQIALKNFSNSKREVLVNVLKQQYDGLEISEKTQHNIDALANSDTFTITTGHQLNIFTGPLYFIYKIVTTIVSCAELQKEYPEYRFVPVYWMGSEDHDFEEISYFFLNNKKYQWESQQTGAVGRFNPKELKAILEQLPGHHPIFEKAYLKHSTLADACRYYVNELFKDFGLVILDADSPELKKELKEVIKKDVLEETSYKAVLSTSEKLQAAGYHEQLHPREINFFYLEGGIRNRIEKKGDFYEVIDTDIRFTENEITKLIDEEPEKFSPNVILRPLYEEIILPNLAYVGGPSELTYWFQLKEVFKVFNTPFPILLPRSFGLVMPPFINKKWQKTGFGINDLFKPESDLITEYTLKNTTDSLKVNGQKQSISNEFEKIKMQAIAIDGTLGAHVEAQTTRFIKAVEGIEKKMLRAEKRKMSDKTGQITAVKNYLFPNGGLQERRDNFLNFYMEDKGFIDKLVKSFDPFDLRFHVLIHE